MTELEKAKQLSESMQKHLKRAPMMVRPFIEAPIFELVKVITSQAIEIDKLKGGDDGKDN